MVPFSRRMVGEFSITIYKPYDFKVIIDEKTKDIYTYLVNKHTRGSNKKSVTLDGITYADIDDVVKKTGLSKRTIYRRLKAQG